MGHVAKLGSPCPFCGEQIIAVKAVEGCDPAAGLVRGDMVVCYGCARPSVWTGVRLRAPIAVERLRYLTDPASVLAVAEAMVRGEPGLVGLFDRVVWPGEESCPTCAVTVRAAPGRVGAALCVNPWHEQLGGRS